VPTALGRRLTQALRNSSGNFATLAEIRLASIFRQQLRRYCLRVQKTQLVLSVGLTRPSVAMRARRPAIRWLTRESTSVYDRKRYL
jgi:hypothetical protein